jgi:hypothetical protein
MTHLTRDDAGRWVAGLLEAGEAAAFERHAQGCGPCEALLAVEARAEVRLAAALEALPAPGPRRARSARLAVLLVPLALAASLAVFLVSRAAEEDHSVVSAPRYEHDHQVPLTSLAALGPSAL